MFKKFMEKLIFLLRKIYGKFNCAYNETYSDKKMGIEAFEEIEKRKQQNKNKFINAIKLLIGQEVWNKEKIVIPEKIAEKIAADTFNNAKELGMFDELNSLK